MVHISFYVFYIIGVKKVFELRTCNGIRDTTCTSCVDRISCLLRKEYNMFLLI